jgi:membrane-associated phospholipid phosphatase
MVDAVMEVLSGPIPWIVIAVAILAYASAKKSIFGFTVLFALVCAAVGTNLLFFGVVKPLFAMLHACDAVASGGSWLCAGSEMGLPSGHAADGMAAATVGFWAIRGYGRYLPFAGAALIGISRVYLGSHSVSDVLIAYIFGAAVGSAVYWLFVAGGRGFRQAESF